MNEDQITVLSREYAEEAAKEAGVEFDPHDWAVANCVIETKDVIKFLLRRYCLVEKSKVKEEYNLALSNIEKAGSARPLRQSYYDGRSDALESLFPEIAKDES